MDKAATVRRPQTDRRSRTDWRPLAVRSQRCTQIALGSALVFVAGFLLWRRIAGTLNEPLPAVAFVAVAGALLLANFGGRWLADGNPLDPVALISPLASISALLALTLPATSLWAAILSWSILVAGSAVIFRDAMTKHAMLKLSTPNSSSAAKSTLSGWRVWVDGITRIDSPHVSTGLREQSTEPSKAVSTSPAAAASLAKNDLDEPAADRPDEQLMRQLSRGVDELGQDVISGWVKLPLTAGQRSEVAHIEFCPPFLTMPRAEAWCEDDADAQVKISQQMHHGMVLELRLSERPTSATLRTLAFHVVQPEHD